LHLSNFTYEGVSHAELGARIGAIVTGAEAAGFDRLSVMDHYFQIAAVGPVENEMFEAYNLLGFIAAKTSRMKLGVLATGVTYRHPGYLAKQVAGLDVLSGGRAWLGIGAAWFEREHLGLGIPFPPLGQRFEMLEECIQICEQMWSGTVAPYNGKHYQLAETRCSPLPLQKPRPPILIAGSGEKKTLRLVAKYGDACNVAGGNLEVTERLLGILADHCAREGRDYDSIEKTVVSRIMVGPNGEGAEAEAERLAKFADLGVQTVITSVHNAYEPRVMEAIATTIIPMLAPL
jgi:F420-dependent oxidoreductase-like protein